MVRRDLLAYLDAMDSTALGVPPILAKAGVELSGRRTGPMEVRAPVSAIRLTGETVHQLPCLGCDDDYTDPHSRTKTAIYYSRGGIASAGIC